MVLEPWTAVYRVGLALCTSFALIGSLGKPSRLILCALGITVLGSFYGLDLVNHGQSSGRIWLASLGQSLLIFVSVVGGALLSTACAEIRARRP
jgi:hypothetical protein